MDAVLGNMRTSFGTSVRKMFSSNNNGTKNNEKNNEIIKMSLCNICENERSLVPFIVRDVAKFIQQKSMKLEGIFRVSAPIRQVNELRELYETNANFSDDLLLKQDNVTEVTGHAAAGLLKQFFRQLSEPLITEDVLTIFMECKCLSEKDFCERVKRCMDSWPIPHQSTLIFLLTFLHTVAQESENRMSVNGLAVVFGPNVFKLPDGIEGLQAQGIANQTFERLLSCSRLLSKNDTPPIEKREPPPRPDPPVFNRPLPQTPQNNPPPILPRHTSTPIPLNGLVGHISTEKPVPVARKNYAINQMPRQQNGVIEKLKMPHTYASIDDEDFLQTSGDAKPLSFDNKLLVASQHDPIPYIDATPPIESMLQLDNLMKNFEQNTHEEVLRATLKAKVTASSNTTNRTTAPFEVQSKAFERSDSADSGNNTGELQDSVGIILDSSIRQIVQTRLFNSAESSSVSDDAESFKSNSLLPSTTAGRNRGPTNRRRPTRPKNLLNNVHFDEDSEEEGPVTKAANIVTQSEILKKTVAMKTDKINQSSELNSPVAIGTENIPQSEECHVNNNDSANFTSQIPSAMFPSVTSSVTTVMTPDSGCIIEDSDYPCYSSPIKAELARLEIGRSLSPVFIPKLNLRNSLDEEEMLKIRNQTPLSFDEPVPQLDLTSVTDSPDNIETNNVPKRGGNPEKNTVTTPPRPIPRQSAPMKQVTRKKKKKHQAHKKAVHKLLEITPQPSDCEITEEDCDETMEQARDKMSQNMRNNRRVAGRPFDIARMILEELKEEKLYMQRELLKFEARHGRPTTKDSKQVMREIYDRYRAVKRLLANNQGTDENENTIKQLNDSFLVTRTIPSDSCCDVTNDGKLETSEILLQIRELRGRRKRLRKILAEFEAERKADGSNLERRVMRMEYEEYKSLKTKLRELEIALAKKGVEIP